jgi:hypothetical protein
VPIADLNGKTLDEVFISNALISLRNENHTWRDLYNFSQTALSGDNLYLIFDIINVNVAGSLRFDYIGAQRVAAINNVTIPTYFSYITSISNDVVTFRETSSSTTPNIDMDINLYVINLTALGITATKEQLDFWYSVWQQNHKLGMRVHRASGNDIPLAVLNNQSLNQVFVGGNLVQNGGGNTLTGWTFSGNVTTDGEFIVINSSSAYSLIQALSGLSSEKYLFLLEYIGDGLAPTTNLSVTLRQNSTVNSNVILIPNSTTILTTFSDFFNTTGTFNQILFSRNGVGSITKIKNIYLLNLTSLGIATLTKSQLDYLFTVWQFNQVNALVARQFIQEA